MSITAIQSQTDFPYIGRRIGAFIAINEDAAPEARTWWDDTGYCLDRPSIAPAGDMQARNDRPSIVYAKLDTTNA